MIDGRFFIELLLHIPKKELQWFGYDVQDENHNYDVQTVLIDYIENWVIQYVITLEL